MNLILIIDEDSKSLDMIREALSGKRFRVISTTSLRQGIEFARAGLPGLIVLDMGRNASETLRVLEGLTQDEITRGISIVVTLRSASKAFIVAAKKMGVMDFLLKPFDAKNLEQKLNQILFRGILSDQQPEYKEQESETLKHVQIGNRQFFFIKKTLDVALTETIQEKANRLIEKGSSTIILDIRSIGTISDGLIENLDRLIGAFQNCRLILVAGSHYRELVSRGLDRRIKLFQSSDELNLYFEFIEGKVPD